MNENEDCEGRWTDLSEGTWMGPKVSLSSRNEE
jgi:hypothetical protein